MSYIDVTGKTEEEAIRKALQQLQMDRDDVSVEILERAKSGFLGIGSSPARVRVTYGQEEPEAPAATVQPEKKPEKKPEPKPQPKPQQPKPQKAEAPKAAPKAPEAPKTAEAPAAPVQESCQDDNARRITEFLTGLLEHMDSPVTGNPSPRVNLKRLPPTVWFWRSDSRPIWDCSRALRASPSKKTK